MHEARHSPALVTCRHSLVTCRHSLVGARDALCIRACASCWWVDPVMPRPHMVGPAPSTHCKGYTRGATPCAPTLASMGLMFYALCSMFCVLCSMLVNFVSEAALSCGFVVDQLLSCGSSPRWLSLWVSLWGKSLKRLKTCWSIF